MTDTALSLDHVGTAIHETAAHDVPAADRKSRTPRVLSGALVAGLIAALMVVIGNLVDRSGSGSEWLAWVTLWAVAFVALLVGVRLTHGLARATQRAWTAWQEHERVVRTDEMMAAIQREDPRLYRELQIIRDRDEWVTRRALTH